MALPATPAALATPTDDARARVEVFSYDDQIVRWFILATVIWGAVGMLVGVLLAIQLPMPSANFGEYLSFGRLRPLHTNAVIFAFAGNSIFAAIYYSTQRLCKARMFSDAMSRIHFSAGRPSSSRRPSRCRWASRRARSTPS